MLGHKRREGRKKQCEGEGQIVCHVLMPGFLSTHFSTQKVPGTYYYEDGGLPARNLGDCFTKQTLVM